ncbi:hypothetical protein [Nodularia sphaerocarpa]|uniref:hypothetical protein n=1 Tax=Nodularia sphaerocarpa TaxID=137816 RepID=UPI00232DE6F0|nr:hypothetical protein [Nodularia sphaerocarpa]MDB9373271.1 hypothetical protein [Nodularia sphaerocarpa CS-585]MDB9378420.1 hypothetical protein [Nodularia sphaerocarpa CS-585A2]
MAQNKTRMKTYTVSVTVEAKCQLEVEATSVKSAKAKAKELADSSIEILFNGNCQSPASEVLPIDDDAVEE